ncbi:MAG: DUF4157 domain-containing protein [Gammaproteobacteria bacterium]|nr:DUF4157 domain-containing protein [Gammaproteobacteria bacterium]
MSTQGAEKLTTAPAQSAEESERASSLAAKDKPSLENTVPSLQSASTLQKPTLHLSNTAEQSVDQCRATEHLASEIAGLLGLSLRHLDISVDTAAQRETEQRGVQGLVKHGKVLLHPHFFNPHNKTGRYLLGHELTHIAQLQSQRTRHGKAVPVGKQSHEHEAHHIASLIADQRLPSLPQWELPDHSIAAFEGEVPAAETESEESDISLDAIVAQRYADEIARIRRLLRGFLGFLWVTDGDITQVLIILQSVPFVTVRAIVSALDSEEGGARYRNRLIGEIDSSHFARFRREILAAYSVMPSSTLAEQDEGIFEGMDFHRLSNEEHWAILQIRENGFPQSAWQVLRDDEQQGEAVRQILDDTEGSAFDVERATTEARDAVQREIDQQASAIQEALGDERLAEIVRHIINALRNGANDEERLVILDLLIPTLREPDKLQGVALLLQNHESGDLIDRLVDDFPVTRLYQGRGDEEQAARERRQGETRLVVLLRLISHRDPWRNVQLAEDLISTGFFEFDWMVNDEEAYLAHQLIRMVPESMRESFLTVHGETIDENVSQSMRESETWNFYSGGEGRMDQANIQAQLLDEELWSLNRMAQLEGLLRMAITAGEHQFVFNQSRMFYLSHGETYRNPDFIQRIVEPFQLFNPDARNAEGNAAPRKEYDPAYLESMPWYQEGVLSYFDSYVVQGLDFIFSSDNVDVLTNSIGGSGLNAVEFQDMFGGNFMGIRFQDFEELGEEGEQARERQEGVNFIDSVRWDQNEGVLQMTASQLAIATVRYPVGSMLFRAGEGRIQGLDLNISYPTEYNRHAPSLRLELDQLDLNETMLVFSDSMVNIDRIELRGLHVAMGEDGIRDTQDEARGGLDPGATLFTFIMPGIPSLLQILRIPMQSSGELQAGLLTPEQSTALVFRWDDLRVQGITTSGGQFIEEVQLSDFQTGLAGSREDYLQILFESLRDLTRRKADLIVELVNTENEEQRTALQERIDRIETQRQSVHELRQSILDAQTEVEELQERQRDDPDNFDTAARERLDEQEAFLRTFDRGGMTLDAGRIAIRGLRGSTELGALNLTDIHGTGGSGAGILAALTESDTLSRIIEGGSYQPPVLPGREREEVGFELDLGDFEIRELRIRDAIPTIEDAEQELEQLRERLSERPWHPLLRAEEERLGERLARTRQYHEMAEIGVTYMTAAQRYTFRALRESLSNEEAFYAHHIRAQGASLRLGSEGQDISLVARQFDAFRPRDEEGNPIADAPGIRAGDLSIGEIHGQDIEAGLQLSGGLLGGMQDDSNAQQESSTGLRRRITELGLSGTDLQVDDIRFANQDLSVDHATLAGFGLRLRPQDGTLEASAERGTITGLRQMVTEDRLNAEIALLEAKPESQRTDSENQRLVALQEALGVLQGFEQAFNEYNEELAAATTDQERNRVQQEIRDTLRLYQLWSLQLGARSAEVDALGVRVSGLGNVLYPDYSFDDALESGIVIEGTGSSESQVDAEGNAREDQLFGRAVMTDARFGAVASERISAGETLGRVEYSHSRISVQNLHIEELSATGFEFQSSSEADAADGGGTIIQQLWSHGTSTARGIDVSADLFFERGEEERDEYQLRRIRLHSLRINELEGQNLGYGSTHNPPDPLQEDPEGRFQTRNFELASGAIHGIWASDIHIDLPAGDDEEMRITGRAGVESLSDARVNAYLEDALDFGHARLNGSHLAIEFLQSGERIIDVGRPILNDAGEIIGHEGGLVIDEGQVRTGDGNARFSTGRLRGRVRQQGDVYHLENVRLDSLTLQRFNWRAGAKRFIGEEPTVISGIRIDATVDMSEEDNTQVQLDRVHVDRIVSQHFEYSEPPLTVRIRQDENLVRQAEESGDTAPAPLEIVDVDITNLHWSPQRGMQAGGERGEGLIEVEQVHTAFDLLRNDMDLDVVVDVDDIDLRFRRDGAQVLTIDELDAHASGTAADGVEIDVTVDDLNTGEVRIFDDRIEVPDLHIPSIDIDHLSVTSDSLCLEIPNTAGVMTLTNTQVDADIFLDPDNEDEPVSRIVIYELRVQEILSRGLSVTIPDVEIAGEQRDVTITTSHMQPITVSGFRLGSREEGGEGFIITPDPSGSGWRRDGLMHFDHADGERLAVEVENLFGMTTNFDATNFDLGQLDDGRWTLDLQRLQLEELMGRSGDHHFNVSTEAATRTTQTDNPEILLQGLHRNEDGTIILDEASLSGFVYHNPEWDLRLDIQKVSLPQQLTIPPERRFVLPQLIINNAQFSIDDILGMSSEGSGGGSSSSVLQDMNFLNALHGVISLDVDIEYFPNDHLDIPVNHGVIDLEGIEDQLGYDLIVDFDVEDRDLVLNIDWGNAIGLIPAMVPQANEEALRWVNLTPEERRRAEEDEEATVSTLVERFPTGGGGGPDPDPFVELHDIEANLTLEPTTVNLGSHGEILLGGAGENGAVGIHVEGDIPSQIRLAVEQINAHLNPSRPLRFGGVEIDQGSLVIENIENTSLNFTGFTPGSLSGNVRRAEATNFRIDLGSE